MREWGLSEEITRLVFPPNGTPPILHLHLRELGWWLNETNLSFLPKFLPHLTKIAISTNTLPHPGDMIDSWDNELPDEVVPMIRSGIQVFPSSLHILHIILGIGPQTHLTKEISTFILEHEEALQDFSTNVVLSTQAIVHLTKLPRLFSWNTEQGLPEVAEFFRHGISNKVTYIFPSLVVLQL